MISIFCPVVPSLSRRVDGRCAFPARRPPASRHRHLPPQEQKARRAHPLHPPHITINLNKHNTGDPSRFRMTLIVKVDVIIAVHNAESTVEETVLSALHQIIPNDLLEKKFYYKEKATLHSDEDETELCMKDIHFDVLVCCYNDASTDKSLEILHRLEKESSGCTTTSSLRTEESTIAANLVVGTSPQGTLSRGAGYARNQAAKLRSIVQQSKPLEDHPVHHFLCILDSDDIMHPTRIAEQSYAMLSLGYDEHGRHFSRKTLMGCQFDRIPKDSTWHYQRWANSLTDERLYLEQFRECTLIQPTWFIAKDWFDSLGGYLEAPTEAKCGNKRKLYSDSGIATTTQHYRLIHPSELLPSTDLNDRCSIRLAEDTRFFYSHLLAGGKLHLHRTSQSLVSYRHRSGMSQSSSTPRRLLLKLRAKAWEHLIYHGNKMDTNTNSKWKQGFAIWGAGRDGKDFLKALSPEVASSVVCFVDVDEKKINQIKFYDNSDLNMRVPILHFSVLRSVSYDVETLDAAETFGRINKRREHALPDLTIGERQPKHQPLAGTKKPDKSSSDEQLPLNRKEMASLPVVVCVAMYRSNGALEKNVASIGRVEGENLWHIC